MIMLEKMVCSVVDVLLSYALFSELCARIPSTELAIRIVTRVGRAFNDFSFFLKNLARSNEVEKEDRKKICPVVFNTKC